MIISDKRLLFPAAFNDEKVGKVFVVVSDDLRRCHICDELFTRQEACTELSEIIGKTC